MQRSEMTFERGTILRKEMLTDLYEYPRMLVDTYFASYSDGILFGLEWKECSERQNHHLIMPGALKFHGKIYILSEAIDVEDKLDGAQIDKKYRLVFVEKEAPIEEPSRKVYSLDLMAMKTDEFEASKGRGFYYSYVEFTHKRLFGVLEDEKEIFGLHAGRDGYPYALPPQFLRKKLLPVIEQKEEKHPLDYEVLKMIYQQESLPLSMVKLYLREYYGGDADRIGHFDEIVYEPKKVEKELLEACEHFAYEVQVVRREEEAEEDVRKRVIIEEGGVL